MGLNSDILCTSRALFAVVFTASYTANLAAFMITKEDYDRLTGIKDWRVSVCVCVCGVFLCINVCVRAWCVFVY